MFRFIDIRKRIAAALVVVALSACSNARADLIVVVGDWTSPIGAGPIPTYNAGTTQTIPVYIYTNQLGTNTLSDYVITFDFDTVGVGYSGIFSGFTADFSTSPVMQSPLFQQSLVEFTNYDFKFSASAVTPALVPLNATSPATAMKLFDLSFNISPTAATGTHSFVAFPDGLDQSPIPMLPPQNPNSLNGTGFSLVNGVGTKITPMGGQFKIMAVPEPSAAIMLISFGAVFSQHRRRRNS